MSEQYRDNEEGVSCFRRGRYRTALSVFDDNVEWTIPGDSMISGNWRGKDDLSQLFMQLAEKSTAVEPKTFLSDGDVVVVLTEVTAGGETSQEADVFTFRDGKVIKAQSFGETPCRSESSQEAGSRRLVVSHFRQPAARREDAAVVPGRRRSADHDAPERFA